MAAYAGVDDFNSYSDGDLTGNNGGSGFSGAWSGSTLFDVQGTVTLSGTGKAIVKTGTDAQIGRLMTSTVNSGDMYFAVRGDATGYNYVGVGGATYATQFGVLAGVDGANLVYIDNLGSHIITTATSGSWYIINVNFINGAQWRFRWKVKGGSFSSFSGTLGMANSQSNPQYVWMAGGNSGTTYVDDIGTTDPDAPTDGGGRSTALNLLGVGQ